MATLYANSTGNWTAAIWYDIATSQPYANTYPQVGDYVYLNGKTITANININIGSGTITNNANSNYGIVSGGQINTSVNGRSITANIEAYPYSHVINGTHRYTYSGNIYSYIPTSTSYYPLYLRLDSTSTTLTLNNANLYGMISNNIAQGLRIQNNTTTNGNNYLNLVNTNCDSIAIQNFSNTPTASHVFTVEQNGNMVNCTIRQYGTINYTINGMLKQEDRIILSSVNNLQVTGEYYNLTNTIQSITSFVIAGNVHYIKDFGGFYTNNISYLTPMTTQFINEGTSPFQIVNSNTGIDYPPESSVKKDTEYAWGEMSGTLELPPESVVLKDYEYDTITAEENDIATYNLTIYIYADYGTLHWFELKTTTTDIVTDPTLQSIDIDGDTVAADTDYVVEYNDDCYQWDGSAWGGITTNNIGTVKTDIVTNPTETTLCAKKGTLETSNLPQTTLDRMANILTVDIFQQILDAHLNG